MATKFGTGCLKTDTTNEYDNDLLLRQETKKKIPYPGNWYNNDKKKTLI